MTVRSFLHACSYGPLLLMAQPLTPLFLTELPPPLQEASGILCLGGATWVCLDSGNPNRLYQVDTTSGQVLRELELANASNVDWEEVTADAQWAYVGDIGNNAGMRTDLRIYRFPLETLTGTANTVVVDTIRFQYADQDTFTPLIDGTNWDAEAFIAFDDSLFLFTKNWVDEHTHLYVLPAEPGVQVAVRRAVFNAQGLVTGAARDPLLGDIVLLGHTRDDMQPFIWSLRAPGGHDLFSGANTLHPLTVGSMQAEGVALLADGRAVLANEGTLDHAQALWTLTIPLGLNETFCPSGGVQVFPVPADRRVKVEGADLGRRARIVDLNGTDRGTVRVGEDGWIDLPLLAHGEYVLDLMVHAERCRVPLLIFR